ncbi:MAG: PfkB family carbohydrate kinase [Lentisphaeria bacterium]|nr:PfkB family carbohydrate kinase [Lentisphaeria bacterium]
MTENTVNRAKERILTAGGKGVHVTRACNQVSTGSSILLHLAGGINGSRMNEILRSEQIPNKFIEITDETRCCTTLISKANHRTTELIDPSPMLNEEEVAKFKDLIKAHISQAEAVCLCGTYPQALGKNFYEYVAQCMNEDQKIVVDAYKGINGLLNNYPIFLLKINRQEICKLSNEKRLDKALRFVQKNFQVENIAITDGPGHACLVEPKDFTFYNLPLLSNPVNPIGAGDTATGITTLNYLENGNLKEAFRRGLGAATASCLRVDGAGFELEEVEIWTQRIKMVKQE